ncbi:uncharacterized protein TRUGW13939_09213 [Talaromyces rugulosus]|uniref:Helicase C-terminal domain-containing protein n=1 Tax=Talaromyces rugulosus TaxID=121627 RepID=A0A7H8R7D7_TALRU|nr:uncharacterized protein TRUGW13939_09213 [Talaromyces rugulosus]QKX62057.1 hypothetical protein TRUGW13939_09213 [Talaromyces rugulosus]
MDSGLPQAPNKRRRLDASVPSLLNPTSIVVPDYTDRIIAEDVNQNNEVTGNFPTPFNSYQAGVGNIAQIPHTGLPTGFSSSLPQSHFENISRNERFGGFPTGFENHTPDTVNQNYQLEVAQGTASQFQNCNLQYESYYPKELPPLVGNSIGSQRQPSSMLTLNPVATEIPSKMSVSSLFQTAITETSAPTLSSIYKDYHTHPGGTVINTVCFGMFSGVTGEFEVSFRHGEELLPSPLPVHLETAGSFTCDTVAELKGTVSTQHTQLLQAILDESSIRIQATCTWDEKGIEAQCLNSILPKLIPCSLSFTLYGPMELCEELGTFFQDHEIYLQDPLNCDVNVLQTDILEVFDVQGIPHQSYLLEILDQQEDLPEASQPSIIQAQLERHQKQAMSFMLRREQGWAFDSSSGDLWGWKKTGQGRFFINMISGDHQREEPKQFFGGIIADPMGLGKTLTMISLVAADLERENTKNGAFDMCTYSFESNDATLIVVPPALLDTWEEQLSQQAQTRYLPPALAMYLLHIAHFIRNSSSQMAKSVCNIQASARWAVTGTPIQNRLGDLAALFKVLDVYPYGDIKHFDAHITHLWKTGESEKAMERLKRLSRCLTLRRPKTTINLPTRTDLRCLVNFTPDERALYEKTKSQAIAHFTEAATHEGADHLPSITFVNIIQQINALRMVCDMGMHYYSRYDVKPAEYNTPSEPTDWTSVAQQTFNFQCEITSIACQLCKSTLDITERLFSDSNNHLANPLFFQCRKFVCPDCVQHSREGHTKDFLCGHSPPHIFAEVSLNRDILEDSILMPAHSVPRRKVLPNGLPSKVTSLLRRLKDQAPNTKSVVFSTWRMTLDVVESGLEKAKIQFLRYDGKVPQKERHHILDRFRRDPSISVLLLTLSCGAVGLTLTEASYAYLMEPHWNPTVEEQALARIHRLGQKKEVTTVRFYVKDTFEERVMEVQRSKEDLAGMLFSSDNSNSQSGNKARLELIDLIAPL